MNKILKYEGHVWAVLYIVGLLVFIAYGISPETWIAIITAIIIGGSMTVMKIVNDLVQTRKSK